MAKKALRIQDIDPFRDYDGEEVVALIEATQARFSENAHEVMRELGRVPAEADVPWRLAPADWRQDVATAIRRAGL